MAEIVIHCDWSLSPKKRFMAHATRRPDGWTVYATEQVPVEPIDLIKRFLDQQIFLGLDLPLGVPLAWAKQVGITSFRQLLELLAKQQPPWDSFFDVAESPAEISLYRPFYPKRPGGTKLQHLVDGLNLADPSALRRQCDRPTDKRGAAAPLFWTMGAQQVGKAALSAWQELLIPLVMGDFDCALWPFDGDLAQLEKHQLVVAEVYPAEIYSHIGIAFPVIDGKRTGKRSQLARRLNASNLMAVGQRLNVVFDTACQAEIKNGFGDGPEGEDRFDSLVGLLGMLLVLEGEVGESVPADPMIRHIEGWLLGLAT